MNSIRHNNRILEQALIKNHYRLKQLFHDIYESVSGTEQDFTNGSLRRAILLLSIPMVLEMLMESIFAIVDIYFVSKLGAGAVATVGLTESIISLIYAIAIGFSTATTAVVSRRIGEKNPSGAGNAAFQAIILGCVASLVIGIPGIIYAERLLLLMGSPAETASELSSYTAIMLGGNVVIMLLFIINSIFRSSGDAAVSMKVLWMANIINIILVPCLIFGLGPFPEMGIAGAAVATTTGRGLAVVYQFYLLFSGKKRIKLEGHHLKIDLKVIGRMLKLSLGGMGQTIITTSSWIALVRIIALYGSEVVAGYTIGIRLVVFALLPSLGISNAAATLVGQNLGAHKADRAEKSVWTTGWINLVLMGVIGLIFVFLPGFFIRLFIGDSGVVDRGIECLRIISYGFIAYGFGMVLVNSFNGAGDTSTPLKINIFCYWLLEIPLAYLLAITLHMEEQGVFYSILIAEVMMTVISFIIFRRGKWKLKRV